MVTWVRPPNTVRASMRRQETQSFNRSQCTELKGDAKEEEPSFTVQSLNFVLRRFQSVLERCSSSSPQRRKRVLSTRAPCAPQANTLLGAVRAFSSGSTRKRRLGPSRHTLGWPNSASTLASTPDTTRAACMCTKPARDHASLISR